MKAKKIKVCAKHKCKLNIYDGREYCIFCHKYMMPWNIIQVKETEVKE